MPTARRMATPRNSATTATKQSRADLAVAERRQHHVVGRPPEHPGVGHGQRTEQQAADRGEGEDPLLALDRDPQDGEPLAGGRALVHVSPPSSRPRPATGPAGHGIPRHRPGGNRRRVVRPRHDGARMVGLPPLRATFARRERRALAETALRVGPDAPTLCGDWDTKDLVCHLLVRESSLVGAPGIAVSALSGLTDKEMARLKKQPFEKLVDRLRTQQAHLLRAAAGRRDGQHAGVLRAPRGHPARRSRAGAAAPSPRRRSTPCGRP